MSTVDGSTTLTVTGVSAPSLRRTSRIAGVMVAACTGALQCTRKLAPATGIPVAANPGVSASTRHRAEPEAAPLSTLQVQPETAADETSTRNPSEPTIRAMMTPAGG